MDVENREIEKKIVGNENEILRDVAGKDIGKGNLRK